MAKLFDAEYISHNTVVLSLLTIPECTLKEPVRFFDKFIPQDLLKQMLEGIHKVFLESDNTFMTASEYEINRFEFTIIKRSKIGDWDFVREFKMQELMKSIFNFHLIAAYYFIKEKAESDALLKSKKEFFQNIVFKLKDRWLTLRKIDYYNKHIEVYSFPFEALIQFIYNEYPLYAPKKNSEINEIFFNSQNSKHLYEKQNLKPSVINDILSLRDKKGKKLWIIYDEDTFRSNLKYFVYNQYNKITEPIVFNQHAEAAYYLIYKLIQYTGKTESEKELQTIFRIKGKMYTANSSYTAKNKIQRRGNSLKQLIDDVVFSNLT
jgi:hypothetical protein